MRLLIVPRSNGRSRSRVALVYIALICLVSGSATAADDVRGLWVIRTSLGSAAQVQAMVGEAHDSGFNILLVQVRGRGDALYDSDHEPRAEHLDDNPSFDPLAIVIEAAHAHGLEVHAWVNTHLVWGPVDPPRSPLHLVNSHPDWLAVPRSLGRSLHDRDPRSTEYLRRLTEYAAAAHGVEGLFTSPSHPAVQDRMVDVLMDLVGNYELDGIHFDYIRFPSPAFDYSRGALNRFRSWVRPRISASRYAELDAASWDDPYALADGLPDLWNWFRRDQITVLVRRAYHAVKVMRPDLIVSAAVLPDPRRASEQRFQAWWAWLSDGILDVAVPMAYTDDQQQFRDWIRGVRESTGSFDRLWIGIGAYKNPVEETLRQIDYASGQGFGGVVVFAYDLAASTLAKPGTSTALERIGKAAFGGAEE